MKARVQLQRYARFRILLLRLHALTVFERCDRVSMPLAAHRFFARFMALGVQQEPHAPARRARSRACVVPREAPVEIVGPSDVGSIAVYPAAAENIHEAFLRWISFRSSATVRQRPRISTMFDLTSR